MLTQILKDHPDVADRLMLLAIDPAREAMERAGLAPLLAPLRVRDHAAKVGTAFDYFLRWETERRNPSVHDREWVAELALHTPLLSDYANSPVPAELHDRYCQLVQNARVFHTEQWLPSTRSSETNPFPPAATMREAVIFCLRLANVDPVYRAGKVADDPYEFDEKDVEDMLRLSEVVPWGLLGADSLSRPRLNPDFGSISKMFRGADPDLMVEWPELTVNGRAGPNFLIDYKTVLRFDITKYLPQLMGYVVLGKRFEATHEDIEYRPLTHAGIYFSRHGKLVAFLLDDVYNHPDFEGASELLFRTAKEELETLAGRVIAPAASVPKVRSIPAPLPFVDGPRVFDL